MVFLMETKNKVKKLESIRRSTSFDGQIYVNPVGRSGGLALWWRNSFSIAVSDSSKNLIVVEGSSSSPYFSFRACFIYGPHLKRERSRLWNNIIHQSKSSTIPFLVIGDFNLIGQVNDKQGGSSNISGRIEEFQEFMYSAELFEIPSKGLAYTWDNKRIDWANVRERIDQALGNDLLLEAFPYQSLTHLPLIGSDHSPLLYQTCSGHKKKRKKFKFESMWTLENSCEDVIGDSWSTSNLKNEIECLRQNLTSCAAALSSWSRGHFGNNRKIIGEITKELAYLQSLPPTNENGSRQRLLFSKLEQTWLREEMFWHQRSRVNWIKYGDQNSRFFHLSAIHRSQRNKILSLKMTELICEHFVDIYSSSGNENRDFGDVLDMLTPVVNNDMSSKLEAPVHKVEIDKAVKSLSAHKAPGEDGFSGLFFQKYWHIVGDNVNKAIQHFFEDGVMPHSLNKTLVILIPKVSSPETVGQFRPISLCNFVYRVISKIMANRLKPYMHKIVSPQQYAFIPGRLIQDCMIVANEAFHYIRNKKKGDHKVMALKLDLNKAFDRVEWDFLIATLRKLGFGDAWCKWVLACISSYEMDLMINGDSIGTIKPSRVIHQGDPMSPYLFIIVADVLSRLINNAMQNSILTGIKMSRNCPVISHIFFADDSLFFLKAKISECDYLLELINRYCEASGQRINFSKSEVMFSPNTPMNEQTELCSRLGVLKKMQGWKNKLLSQAGREVLIKSVIQSIHSYTMQCYMLPKGFLQKLLVHIKRFFWSGDAHERHIHWLSWEHISQSKDRGGLGFRDLSCFNLALLAKQGWRHIMNPGSFWCRVLKGIYFPHSDFPMASKDSRPSWLWQSLLQGRDLLLHGIRWQVGNGSNILFWTQKWIPYSEDFYIRQPRGETFPASDPLMAELLAIRSACRLAITYGWRNATIESDSRVALSLASSEVEPPWALAAIVVDIKALASQLVISFSWARSECNLAAHRVAKLAFRSLDNFLWDHEIILLIPTSSNRGTSEALGEFLLLLSGL
ncbi:hypothetical protein CTI12_AA306500 [Artemisia annua]|uniref:Reverse transcriptase domain-containing protein n=1 Tax=Artemisia annua TaxID=35608 RepID=A0A2U1MVD0_ARTAN|nr:hypothetical protein CTI12_AA306500 [Artemisia annua]